MKKFLLVTLVMISVQISFAAFPPATLPGTDSTATTAAMPKDFKDLTPDQKREFMKQFSQMSAADYEKMTGKKLNGVERLSLKLTQQRMKHQLKGRAAGEGLFANFNIGGFLLGFLLGLIGVLLAYIFSKDSDLRRWSWLGLGIAVVFYIIILAI